MSSYTYNTRTMKTMVKFSRRLRLAVAITGVAVAGGIWCWVCGRRGFFAFDQSIVFDGAWRILCGQIPYRDFMVPFGPLVFWIQSLFFKFFGVNYTAYLAHAAFFNAFAVLAAVWIVSMLYPRHHAIQMGAGLLTGAWFYPPFGTPWPEQTAFLCALLSLGMTLRGISSPPHPLRRTAALFAAGVLAAAAFFSKQNAGVFFLPLPFIICLHERVMFPRDGDHPDYYSALRAIAVIMAGIIVVSALFAGWIWLESDWTEFINQFLYIPSELGTARLKSVNRLLTKLFVTAPVPTIIRRGVIALVGMAAFAAIAKRWLVAPRRGIAANRLALITGVYALLYQQLYYISSYNSYFNSQPFTGVIFAVIAVELFGSSHSGGRVRNIRSGAVLLTWLMLLGFGVQTGYSRKVHDIFARSTFIQSAHIPPLRALKWGDPTVLDGSTVTVGDMEKLWVCLSRSKDKFFIFPDFTIFYGIIGQPPPQPVLWFHKGLTYPREYDQTLDTRITESLQKKNVRLIIFERESFFGSTERLNNFPLLRDWLQRDFQSSGHSGIFEILERR